jgi:hypothetical protein
MGYADTFLHEIPHSALRTPNKTDIKKLCGQQANLHNSFVFLECKFANTPNELRSGKEFFETQALPKALQHYVPKTI